MPETVSLERPTRRDEAWRYADSDVLETLDLESLTGWRTIEVAAGDIQREVLSHQAPANSTGLVDRVRVRVGAGGRFEAFVVLAGDAYQRIEIEVTLEDGAHFEFGGVTVGGDQTTQEFVTRTIHAQPNATSNQTVRAVHWGQATGNFLGRIEVVKHAQKTDAAQNFRAILLDKGASANTKPELEIFADDVQCAHGAAIGELDEAAAYYMASRGIAPEVAKRLLVQAFIGDAFVALDDEVSREQMIADALQKLEGRN